MAGNGVDIGGVISAGTAGLIGVGTMKMIGDTAGKFQGGSSTRKVSVPSALSSSAKQEKFLDLWYQHFPAVYGRYHTMYHGKRKDMIAYFYEDDHKMYKTVKGHFDNLR